jgi:putative nucleotidyltransferase with HDIG domain
MPGDKRIKTGKRDFPQEASSGSDRERPVYKRLETIFDVRSVVFALAGREADQLTLDIIDRFRTEIAVLIEADAIAERLSLDPPDVCFIGPVDDSSLDEKLSLCRALRESGYGGVLILLAMEVTGAGGTSGVTAAGFDNFLLGGEVDAKLEDTVTWAITNRKRKNKFRIQFDNNPDAFFTIDRAGRIYDINIGGLAGLALSPKRVVVGAMNVSELGTLGSFSTHVQPLIVPEHVGRTFTHTVFEGASIFQLKTRIHNVVTIGLVATVVKTDITTTMYERTLDILISSVTLLSQRDNYTAGHSSRVYRYALLIAEALGMGGSGRFMRELSFAALLHDIGKIGVRDNILLKPGKLAPEEYDELMTHSVKGYKMLQHYEFLQGTSDIVLAHHERPDGRGYPDKLRRNRIPFGAAIIAVADGFDAMTSNRPYRRSLPFDKAVAEVREGAGAQFDREASSALLSIVKPEMVEEVRRSSLRPLSAIASEMVSGIVSA